MKRLKWLFLVPLMLSLQGCFGIGVVDTGNRGFLVHFGQVVGEALPEGIYFYNPFTTDLVQLDTRIQRKEFSTEAYTKDIQQATLKVVVNYSLDKDHAGDVYKLVGTDWDDKLVPQTVEGTLKAVIGKWDAVDLIGNRTQAQAEIQQTVTAALATKHVDITRIEITDIGYSHQFETAVEEKVTAIQAAEQQKNVTVNVQEQARQKVIQAEAEAKSMQIRAQALTANPALVQWEAVQKWDGHLPQYMLGGNTTPFINLKQE